MEEAEQAVLAMVDRGVHYREISQVEFNIVGRGLKRFSISEISRLVKDRDEKDKPQSRGEGDLDAEIFRLFEAGKGPTQAVIRLKVTAEKADATYKRWLQMKQEDLSHPSVARRLKEVEDRVDSIDVIGEIERTLKVPFTEEELRNEDLPDRGDLWTLLRNAKRFNALPILEPEKRFCKKCGTQQGLLARIGYKCGNCGEETIWWRHS